MGILSSAFKGIKFAASATVGIPCAVAATAFVGSAYLLAEATNIVEAKVFHPYGLKIVHKNPFFEGVSNSLYGTLKSIWKDYGAYSHIALATWALKKRIRHLDYSEAAMQEDPSEYGTTYQETTPIEHTEARTQKRIKDNKEPSNIVENPEHSKLFSDTKTQGRTE